MKAFRNNYHTYLRKYWPLLSRERTDIVRNKPSIRLKKNKFYYLKLYYHQNRTKSKRQDALSNLWQQCKLIPLEI